MLRLDPVERLLVQVRRRRRAPQDHELVRLELHGAESASAGRRAPGRRPGAPRVAQRSTLTTRTSPCPALASPVPKRALTAYRRLPCRATVVGTSKPAREAPPHRRPRRDRRPVHDRDPICPGSGRRRASPPRAASRRRSSAPRRRDRSPSASRRPARPEPARPASGRRRAPSRWAWRRCRSGCSRPAVRTSSPPSGIVCTADPGGRRRPRAAAGTARAAASR